MPVSQEFLTYTTSTIGRPVYVDVVASYFFNSLLRDQGVTHCVMLFFKLNLSEDCLYKFVVVAIIVLVIQMKFIQMVCSSHGHCYWY